jgi:preprotein translocase subunit SecE
MKDLLPYIITFVIALGVFTILWRQGAFLRISSYCNETKEELHKCTWPTWEELTGSTAVVIVSVGILGGFTVGVDYVVTIIIRYIV